MSHAPEPMHLTISEKAGVIYIEDERGAMIEIEANAYPFVGIRVDYEEELRRAKYLAACVNACAGLTPLTPEGTSVFLECVEALTLILPLAKGYLMQHNVGANAAYVERAGRALDHAQEPR